MYCQLLQRRSLRCEHFDYSGLRQLFPEDLSPIIEEERTDFFTGYNYALVGDKKQAVEMPTQIKSEA